MKVIVTGGNGFIGQHVAAQARARGHQVRVLARRADESSADDSEPLILHDLRHADGLAEAIAWGEAIVHCAASLGGDADAQQTDTVDATSNLLSAMAEAGVRQIIAMSTFAIYDYASLAPDSVLTEDSPLEANFEHRGPYIEAKRRQEDMILDEATCGGWRFTLLRVGIVYGPGRTWFHHLGMQPSPTRWICLAPKGTFPIVHVESCADAAVLALERSEADGEILNLVDDDPPSRRAYVQALAERTNPRPHISEVPWNALSLAARGAGWVNRHLLLGIASLPDLLDPPSLDARCKPLTYPNARAKQLLGWQPRYGLGEGLDRSLGDT